MPDEFSWKDAHSESFRQGLYVRLEPRQPLYEPIDDYTEEEFDTWLSLHVDYYALIVTMRELRDRRKAEERRIRVRNHWFSQYSRRPYRPYRGPFKRP